MSENHQEELPTKARRVAVADHQAGEAGVTDRDAIDRELAQVAGGRAVGATNGGVWRTSNYSTKD